VMGSSHAWISENTEADAKFLEFTGSGLLELREAIKEKQEQMAVMGAKMLQPEKAGVEAYGTVKLRSDAEQSVLVNIAEACSASTSAAMQCAAWWAGTKPNPSDYSEECYLVLPTDFVAAKMDSATFTALVASYVQGAISWPTFFYNLQQGELYPDNWTKEDEEEAMKDAPVMTPPVNPNAPDPNADPGPGNDPGQKGQKTPPAK